MARERKKLFLCLIAVGIISNLAGQDEKETASQYGQPSRGVVATDRLRLREEPNLSAVKVAVLDEGDLFEVLDMTNDFEEIDGLKSFWYQVNTGEEKGWLFGGYALFNPVRLDNSFIGVIVEPSGYENIDYYNLDFIRVNTAVGVYSLDEHKYVQRVETDSASEAFTTLLLNETSREVTVQSVYSDFHTMPISFAYNRIFLYNRERLGDHPRFTYFDKVGMQDSPFAELTDESGTGERALTYSYYRAMGLPAEGVGELTLFYRYRNGSYQFDRLESQVFREGADGKKEKVSLDKSVLIRNFAWTGLPFIYCPSCKVV